MNIPSGFISDAGDFLEAVTDILLDTAAHIDEWATDVAKGEVRWVPTRVVMVVERMDENGGRSLMTYVTNEMALSDQVGLHTVAADRALHSMYSRSEEV